MSRFLRRWLPWVLAAASVVWVARDFDASVFARQSSHLQWGWVAAAVLFDVFTYLLQGVRWSWLLASTGYISPLRATQAVYVGLFANEVLPLRAGEVIRAFLAARWLRTSAVAVAPSMLVERLLDGIWLAVAIFLTGRAIPLDGMLGNAAHALYWIVGAALLVFAAVIMLSRRPQRRSGGLSRFAMAVLDGLHRIGMNRTTLVAGAVSSALLACQAISFWLAMRSCGLDYPLWVGCAVMVIVRTGTMIPGAPANVGTYQFFCTLGLTLFGVERAAAASFSMIVFIMLTVPLWAIGAWALAGTGLSLAQLRTDGMEAQHG